MHRIYSLTGREGFNAATDLNATAQVWHARLLAQNVTLTTQYTQAYNAYDPGAYPDLATATAAINNLEYVGEATGYLIQALLSAFRLTGDLHILDMADALMERCANPLIVNGYFITPTATEFAGPVEHMGQNGLAALIAQMTYVYLLNSSNTSPGGVDYAARYAQWSDYLTNTYLPALGPGPYTNNILRHRGTAYLRFCWYMWKLTGEAWYWRNDLSTGPRGCYGYRAMNAAANRTDFDPTFADAVGQELIEGNRYRSSHTLPYHWGPNPYVVEWAPTHYYRYIAQNLIDLALSGVYLFSDTYMTRYANTAYWCMQNGVNLIKDRVYGEASTNTMTAGQWRVSGLIGLARWSSNLLAFANADYSNVVGVNVHYPAWMLVATV